LRVPIIEEHYNEVPFWKEFYLEPEIYSFEKNISFLLFHCDAIRRGIKYFSGKPLICDFSLFQDLAYARLTGTESDYAATLAVYNQLANRLGAPALVVRVRCSIGEQLSRIAQRGRQPELGIAADYLEDLSRQIEAHRARLLPEVPVVEVDTQALDFTLNPSEGLAALDSRLTKYLSELSA
jgi:deoxyadenosine/deoxycytidine kinase